MSRLARCADRLATGSAICLRRLGTRLAAWCARGRRHDLTGWRAALGSWLRLAVLALSVYALWRLVRAVPNLLWLLAAGWLIAAWRAGKPTTAQASEGDPEGAAPVPDREAVVRLLLEAMGDAPAVHLNTVLAHLQEKGQWEGRTVADLRAALETLNIPVHPKVKAGGRGPTRGVRRADLTPPPVAADVASTETSTAA